jgi:hypothetical protein
MVMCIKYALFQRNDIMFIQVVLGQRKMACAKNGWDASQILRAVKRIEALKMNKYLHPGYFFLGSHRSTYDSGVERASCSSFKSFIRSPRRSMPNADDVRTRLRHTLLVCLLRQSRHVSNDSYVVITSWCVEHGAWSMDCRCVECGKYSKWRHHYSYA